MTGSVSRVRHVMALALKAAAAVAVVSVVVFVAITGAVWAYGEYGYHPAKNAASWAALTPNYADASVCSTCHAQQYARWEQSKHSGVTCESCHGPLAAHAADPNGTTKPVDPTEDECTTCHQLITGRPSTFPQVDLASHYAGTTCLQCHNAHTTIAQAPAKITHPLTNLPTCTTCHGPTALKPFPPGHQVADDGVCLACHQPAQSGK